MHLSYRVFDHLILAYDELGVVLFGVVESDIIAEVIGDTLVEDLFDSLCASRSILR